MGGFSLGTCCRCLNWLCPICGRDWARLHDAERSQPRLVRVRHQRNGIIVCDLFREMAARLTVVGTGSAGEIIVEYGSSGWSGRARVQVLPEVRIEDEVLRS